MFVELMPLLAGRTVLITVAKVDDKTFRAIVIPTLAQRALALLARLFRYGTLCYHGGFINLSTGIGSCLPSDTSMWRRLRRRCKSEKIRA